MSEESGRRASVNGCMVYQQEERADDLPADAPVETRCEAKHLMDVSAELRQPYTPAHHTRIDRPTALIATTHLDLGALLHSSRFPSQTDCQHNGTIHVPRPLWNEMR